MEVVTAVIGPIVESLLVPIKKRLGYFFSSAKHVRNMSTRMKQLDGARVDVQKHMETNNRSNLEIPARVPGWLKDAEKIKEDAQTISSTGSGCFSMKMRYRAGRNAFNITEEIGNLIKENLEIIWSDAQKPLGKVNSQNASTSALPDGDAQNDHFKSREKSFKDALEFLQEGHKSQVIALCGMGGVGKTTMMEQLKKTAEDKKMFDWIVKVVIGQKINIFSVQQAVAEYMGQSLTETSKAARVDRLRMGFGKMAEEKKKVLVILDDVWEMIELKDIGLSPLPNGCRLLLTSRSENICTQIAAEANLDVRLLRVDVMEELEAHNFFWQITGVSEQYDIELNQIGSDIVRRCGFLPLAIKLIATTLKFQKKFVWKNTLQRLKMNNLDKNVQEIIEISFDHIKEEEEKAIFLLCGLFPDDFDISIEELTRYAWGLELLNEVPTLGDARDRTKTCVQNLISTNLLIDSDKFGYVKVHDLVHVFVLGRVSKGDRPWMINHGDSSKWSRAGMSESCKRISITCTGMSEIPSDSKYPNLSLLRLMDGDKSLKFPEDCYERMENLEVIAYEKMQYPLLPRSLQCSTKLRTLLLHRCLLMFDCSAIGELLNLEVLSFAHCGIRKLPSTIGNLKELKLLDLTGCVDLRIDNGVLRSLVKLEELYMRVNDEKAIKFTDDNLAELAELSVHLSALEVEFFDTNLIPPKNMLFTKLECFKISMGRCLLEDTSGNTLMLLTNKDQLLESRIYELFEKTESLFLEVDGMNDLEEVLVESVPLPQRLSFDNLKVLYVFRCAKLRYLFTVPMANGLMKLESLRVQDCPLLEVLAKSENGVDAGVLKFQGLKYLILDSLPEFVGLCNNHITIELPELEELRLSDLPNLTSIYPENTSVKSSMSSYIFGTQPFFNKQVMIPKLKELRIYDMNMLKEIWPYQFSSGEQVNICMLREISVLGCDNLVNLFPRNPMSLLGHLEELVVHSCASIEELFNIDMSCVGEIEEYSNNLRRIEVYNLRKLRELWRMKGESSSDILIRTFQAVEKIEIKECESFVNVVTPTVNNSDVKTLMNVSIDGKRIRHWEETGRNIELVHKNQEINVCHLKDLDVRDCKDVEVAFEIESFSSTDLTAPLHNQQPPLLPYLKDLHLWSMDKMSHVWKCNWNKLVIPKNQSQSSFYNLGKISLYQCNSIKYLFSPPMVKLLPNLKKVGILWSDGIEEVVSNRDMNEDDEIATSIYTHTDIISFPCLEKLKLHRLPCLSSIDGGNATITTTSAHDHDHIKYSEVPVASWLLCKYSKKIGVHDCHALSTVFPSYVVGQLHKLEVLSISSCKSLMEVFESDGVHIGDGGDETCTKVTIPRLANKRLLELPNLTILQMSKCKRLEYIFTSSLLESLKQLMELAVQDCKAMKVIVKEDREHTETSRTIVLPRLKFLHLVDLPDLKGFFLGMNEFRWPLLEKVTIYNCPQMMTFTSGHSMAPKLNHIRTGLGKHSLECGLNFGLTNVTHETQDMIKLHQLPWSFSNLVEVDLQAHDKLMDSYAVFSCNRLHNLKNLEKITITGSKYGSTMVVVFDVVERINEDVNETQSVVVFPKLKELVMVQARSLKHMWKSNRWMVLNFPNLTKVSINVCPRLKHVFTCCMVDSLLQLQELQISDCENMDVIVKQVKDSETRPTEVVFPCLKSLTLEKLPKLKGFCLGKEDFLWSSLDTLDIKNCPEITIFTSGLSTTPQLKLIYTSFGLCDATEDPNTFIKTKQQEGLRF